MYYVYLYSRSTFSCKVESIPIEPLSAADAPPNARQAGGVKVNSGRKKLNKPGPPGRSSTTQDAVSVVDHGENADNVVPALSVINIKVRPSISLSYASHNTPNALYLLTGFAARCKTSSS